MKPEPLPPHLRHGLLERLTIEEVREFGPEVMVIPLGSTEPHGPHLPYGTDALIAAGTTAEGVRLANEAGARVLRLPTLPYGNNVNFKGFPFACRIRVQTYLALIEDLVVFAHEEGVRKVVLFNAHGGNEASLLASMRLIFDRFQQEMFVCLCGCDHFAGEESRRLFTDGSPHAGDFETSVVAHLEPDARLAAKRRESPLRQPKLKALADGRVAWVRPWHEFMPPAFAGRPDLATAEKGEQYFRDTTAGFARFLTELSLEPWTPHFPYGDPQG